jgi:Asp/Glu/hydantoin racemase
MSTCFAQDKVNTMSTTIAFIHTSPSMIPLFKSLADELLPKGHSVFNMVDESLLCDIIREGALPPMTARRLVGHVVSAEEAGANYILVSCSSMGRAVEASRLLCSATVLRVDEPMARRAVSIGRRIGVVATLPSTLEPTVALIRNVAQETGKGVDVTPLVVDGAFAAVMAGDGAKHDALVGVAVTGLARSNDVIVLAQASMARVVDALRPEDKPVPILSSPRLAVEHLASLLQR